MPCDFSAKKKHNKKYRASTERFQQNASGMTSDSKGGPDAKNESSARSEADQLHEGLVTGESVRLSRSGSKQGAWEHLKKALLKNAYIVCSTICTISRSRKTRATNRVLRSQGKVTPTSCKNSHSPRQTAEQRVSLEQTTGT